MVINAIAIGEYIERIRDRGAIESGMGISLGGLWMESNWDSDFIALSCTRDLVFSR